MMITYTSREKLALSLTAVKEEVKLIHVFKVSSVDKPLLYYVLVHHLFNLPPFFLSSTMYTDVYSAMYHTSLFHVHHGMVIEEEVIKIISKIKHENKEPIKH